MIEAIKKRRSVRKYEDTPVSEVQLQQVLDTAMYAASWANKQGWQILVVRGEEKRAKVAAAIEGMDYILIEKERENVLIARARLGLG